MTWWAQEDINLAETESRRMSFLSNNTVKSDSVVTLPVTGNATPMTPLTPMPGWSSPELRTKIQNASPDTARQFALRMYDSLKRHGLRREVERVLAREDGQIEEIKDGEDATGKENDELLGMEYLLKDGFVSYLRDMAKITPPIPQQVHSPLLSFSI